jgi:Zinc knuckle
MEIAYDAAIDWAHINAKPIIGRRDLSKVYDLVKVSNGVYANVNAVKNTGEKSSAKSDDELDAIETEQITCYNCRKKGHFSRNCKDPRKSAKRVTMAKTRDRPMGLTSLEMESDSGTTDSDYDSSDSAGPKLGGRGIIFPTNASCPSFRC